MELFIAVVLLSIVVLVLFIWVAKISGDVNDLWMKMPYPHRKTEEKIADAIYEIDNEVRGTIKIKYDQYRGRRYLDEPTLKGRVDMIEKHLGIKAQVKPEQPAKLIVKKEK